MCILKGIDFWQDQLLKVIFQFWKLTIICELFRNISNGHWLVFILIAQSSTYIYHTTWYILFMLCKNTDIFLFTLAKMEWFIFLNLQELIKIEIYKVGSTRLHYKPEKKIFKPLFYIDLSRIKIIVKINVYLKGNWFLTGPITSHLRDRP